MTTRIFRLSGTRGRARSGGTLTLALDELLPDQSGEIVVPNQAGADTAVVTDDPVTAHGIKDAHVTEAGHDVSGYAYCRFADGITLFYPRSHFLCMAEEA